MPPSPQHFTEAEEEQDGGGKPLLVNVELSSNIKGGGADAEEDADAKACCDPPTLAAEAGQQLSMAWSVQISMLVTLGVGLISQAR